jgi:BlaI family penicillinase repressor
MSKSTTRTSPPELTQAEWAIMKVVWEHQPCAAGTVQEALTRELGWAYSTVKTTMDRMVGKGLLEITRIRNLQLFNAKVDRRQAAGWEFRRMLSRAFDGALGPMMQYLVENEALTREDLDRLRTSVDAARETPRRDRLRSRT